MQPTDVITLQELKLALRVTTDSAEDSEIARKLASAVEECRNYIDGELPQNVDGTVPGPVVSAVVLLVQQDYEGIAEKRNDVLKAVERLLYPYRQSLGI